MTGVIVVECAAFGLTVSEASTKIIFLCTKEMPEATTIFNVEGAGEMYVCMYVCMVITYSRVWINRVRLPILLVVS